jgi:hypothetical protein
MLTVAELMEILSKLSPDTLVTISPDEEGNNLHYAYGAAVQTMYENIDGELACIGEDNTEELEYLKETGRETFMVLEVW